MSKELTELDHLSFLFM